MAILPINSVVTNNHSKMTTFGKRQPQEVDESPVARKSNKAATVPVVVLMAMTPSLLNANEPVKFAPVNNPEMTEVLNNIAKYAPEESTYVLSPDEMQQNSFPYGCRALRFVSIKAAYPAQGNGSPYTLLFTTSEQNDKSKDVSHVYMVPKDFSSNNVIVYPPEVKELIYHNIGKDKEFCGVKVSYYICDSDGKVAGTMTRELRVDDDTANRIIDLLAQDEKSKWNNRVWSLKFSETNRANLMEPIVR